MIVERAALVITLIGCSPSSAPPEPVHPSSTSAPTPAPAQEEALPTYVPPPDPTYAPPPPSTGPSPLPIQIPDEPAEWEAKECKARGGKMQKVCMMGAWECVIAYRDGGKRCSDKKDCTGDCIYEGPKPAPSSATTGVCQRNSNPCGCRAHVIGGHVQPTLCTD